MQLNSRLHSNMLQKEIHMRFRDVASISLLFAAFERNNPHFLKTHDEAVVEDGGKDGLERVFHILNTISTSFPHFGVDENSQ